MKILMLGDFKLPALAHLDLEQRYEPIGPEAILRAGSGRAIKQMTYDRMRITTSANGWVPSGLQSLDFAQTYVMRCIRPESLPASPLTRQATLPAGKYRSDAGHTPWGLAELASGNTVPTLATLAGDVVTLTEVDGAVAYQVGYYPEFTVWLTRPSRSGFSWELSAEEV